MGALQTDDKGYFQVSLPEAGDYHLYVQSEISGLSEDEYREAHGGDFPVLHLALGENGPVTLARKPRPSQ